MRRFVHNDIISLTRRAPRFDVAESVGPDLRLGELLGVDTADELRLVSSEGEGSRAQHPREGKHDSRRQELAKPHAHPSEPNRGLVIPLPGELITRPAEKSEHRMNASVLARVRREAELAEDASDMRLDGLPRHEELLADAAIGSSLGDQCEHLALARGEVGERVANGGSVK